MATAKSKKKRSKAKKSSRKKAQPKKAARKKAAPKKRRARGKSGRRVSISLATRGRSARTGGQSGDLQGLSDVAGADSESVEELIEEGNALEAEAVQGVEDAADADEGEVVTHEVPEDDVPDEYRDQ
jgi:hypothetical protein